MNIIRNDHCDNSPKNNFIQETAIAIQKTDTEFLRLSFTDDVQWAVTGKGVFTGHNNIPNALEALDLKPAEEVSAEFILAHGKNGASLIRRTASDGTVKYISSYFRFTSAKGKQIAEITTLMG